MPKITELTEFSGNLAATDLFPVVNSSLTKKITLTTLKSNVLSGGAVTDTQLATGAVTNLKIADGAVSNAKLQDGSIAAAKLQTQGGLTAGTYGTASSVPVITVNAQGLLIAATTVPVVLHPTGAMIAFATATPPTGWRVCNGSELTTSAEDAALLAFLAAATNPFGVGPNNRPRVPNLVNFFPSATSINFLIKL